MDLLPLLHWSPWFLTSFAFLSCLLLHTLVATKRKTRSKVPPTPIELPLLGHFHLLGKLPHRSLANLSKKYGPVFHLRLGSVPVVVVSSPGMAKDFLVTHGHTFASRSLSLAAEHLTYGGKNIGMSPYGPYWQYLRKLCASELFNPKRIESLQEIRTEEVATMMRSVWETSTVEKEVNLSYMLNILTNKIVCRMAFGNCYSGSMQMDAFQKIIRESMQELGAFNVGDFFPYIKWMDLQSCEGRVIKLQKSFDVVLEEIMEEHRLKKRGDRSTDLIDVLMQVCEERSDQPNNVQLDTECIKAVIFDLLTAGTDTAANAVEWALAELIMHPRVMDKAQKEIDSVVGSDGRVVRESDIPRLAYLQAIVKETFRLHPVSPLLGTRESIEDSTIAGFYFPAKTRLIVNEWAIGRDPEYWEKPLEFHPERFTDGPFDVDIRGHDLHLSPFGAGKRICPGMNLGLIIVHSTLARLVQGFDWSLPSPGNGLDMREEFGLTIRKAVPLTAIPAPRLARNLYR